MTIGESNRSATSGDLEHDVPLGQNPPEVTSKVPYAITDRNYIPKERYFDRGFFELEKKYLWPYSWLMAARLEEVPNSGDFVEFEVAGSSILIVRQQDGSVKALHNACRHRATELARGGGRFPAGQIVCPFHGWRWNIDGSSSMIFAESSFDPACLLREEVRLKECLVEVWAGMVWINMNRSARPFREALAPAIDLLDGVGVGNMRVKWWKQAIVNANWKICQEAFLEGFHVMQTHPQLMRDRGVDSAQEQSSSTEYTAFPNGHGRFQSGRYMVFSGTADDFIENNRLLAEGQDAMALDRDVQIFEGLRNQVGPDENFADEAIKALYEYAAGAGIPMVPAGPNTRLWGGEIYMFPNYFMLPMYGNCECYRFRPAKDDPEWTLMEVWSLTTYPIGEEPERATLMGVFDKEDTEHWGLIPRQDFSNIERQQRGLHSTSFEHTRLSRDFEKNITNSHEELDRVIASRL